MSIQVRSKREKIHAHLFVDDLGEPDVEGVDLGAGLTVISTCDDSKMKPIIPTPILRASN